MPQVEELIERTPAQFFFEVGFGAAYAKALVDNDMKPPFEYSDAAVERAWEIAREAHDDHEEFDRHLALAASPSPVVQQGEGWVYSSPDAGLEYARQHPIESGETPDATNIRRSTEMEDAFHDRVNELDAARFVAPVVGDEGRREASPYPAQIIDIAKAIHGYDERVYGASSWDELSDKQLEQRIGQANAVNQMIGLAILSSTTVREAAQQRAHDAIDQPDPAPSSKRA